MPAVLFGSISTVADTSELQRQAFNEAFEAHGLSWHWDRDDYRDLLRSSGGQQRIADYAATTGETVDAAAVHRSKSEIFQRLLGETPVTPRSGVAETIRQAHDDGAKVALVSLTSRENITALLSALEPAIQPGDFDIVLDASSVDRVKPDAAAYSYALQHLDEKADECVAIEDNVPGVQSAVAAGLTCVAFPNDNTAGHDFGAAEHRVERIDYAELQTFIHSA